MKISQSVLVLLLLVAAYGEKYVPYKEFVGYTAGNLFRTPTKLSATNTIAVTLTWTGSATIRINIYK